MTITAGSRLGPYEIVAPLGAGGMGEVWKGIDTRLERDVAIKILPPGFAQSEQFRARFEREAKTISSLNHPNICTLFDVGHEGDTHFLVMELIEGESLGDRLERGALPLDQVLKYGAQIASALDRAHQQGIVHRDLKPGNVMLTRTDAKLLDFGLARAGTESSPVQGLTEMPTEAAPLTAEGTILGTFQYMAPEQLEGLEADARTDIFAFGALLYEMATGRRAFLGESKTSLIAAIVSSQPEPISAVAPLTPPALDHVVRKCLEKDPDDRWQSAHDIAGQLQWISQAGSQAGVATSLTVRRKTREKLAWGIAVLLAVALGAVGAFWLRSTSGPPPSVRLSIPTHTAEYIDSGAGFISPDGMKVLMNAQRPDETWSYAVRDLRSGEVSFLEGTERSGFLSWSPDGTEVAVVEENRLKAINVLEGTRRDIGELDAGALGGSWGPNDVILVALESEGISRVSAFGGAPELFVRPDPERFEVALSSPTFLPDGSRFLYVAVIRDPDQGKNIYKLRAGALDSTETEAVGDVGSNVALLDSGHLLYVVDGTLTARPFDERSLRFTGRPLPIADGVFYFMPTGQAAFTAARNGTIQYQKVVVNDSVVWLDAGGETLGVLAESGNFADLDISPDGEQVALTAIDLRTGTGDLWLYGLNRDTTTRLTVHPGFEAGPVWSPDGNTIYFYADWERFPDIYAKDLDGAGETRLVFGTERLDFVTDVSPDGRHMIYQTPGPAGDYDLWITPLVGDESAAPFVAAADHQSSAEFSPDGRFIAYESRETGRSEIWLKPFPEAGRSVQISTDGGGGVAWATSGMTLYFAHRHEMYSVDLSTPARRSRPEPQLLFETQQRISTFDVTADGRFLVLLRDDSVTEPINLILNWAPPAD